MKRSIALFASMFGLMAASLLVPHTADTKTGRLPATGKATARNERLAPERRRLRNVEAAQPLSPFLQVPGATLLAPFLPQEGASAVTSDPPAAGPVNYSLALNGTGAHMTVPNNASLNFTGPLTVDAWIKPNTIGLQGIVERYRWLSTPDGGFALRLNGEGRLQFYVIKSNTQYENVTGNTVITTGVWHHVAGVFDGAQLRVYVDGVLDGSKQTAVAPAAGTADLRIGGVGDGSGYFFNGLIDEARLRAGALYEGNFALDKELTACKYVEPDDGSGCRAVWSFRDRLAQDLSGHNNQGTLAGGADYSTETNNYQPPEFQQPAAPASSSSSISLLADQKWLRFDDLPTGFIFTTYQEITFTSGSPQLPVKTYIGAPTLAGGGSSQPHVIAPNGDAFGRPFQVDFPRPVDNLNFVITAGDDFGTIAQIDIYQNNVYKATRNIGGIGKAGHDNPIFIDVGREFNDVTKVLVHDVTDAKGIAYDDFKFLLPPPAPSAPSQLRATATNQDVSLTWNAGAHAERYKVKRSTVSGGQYVNIATVTGTSYIDRDKRPGTTLFYIVTSENETAESGPSNEASALPFLSPPGNLLGKDGFEQAQLTWAPSPGAAKYRVKRTTVRGAGHALVAELPASTTTYVDRSLVAGTTYYYVVTAVWGSNPASEFESQPSNEREIAIPHACGLPTKPRPAAVPVSFAGWTMTAEVTDRDGLVIRDVRLNGRYMMKIMSTPYFVLKTNMMSQPVRGELTPNTGAATGIRVRLGDSGVAPKRAKDGHVFAVGVYADYIVDRVSPDSQSCITIHQEYIFRESVPGDRCEPSAAVPCSRMFPLNSYVFTGGQVNGQREELEFMNMPQRLHVQVNGQAKNSVGFFHDCNRAFTQVIGATLPLCGLEGWVFDKKANPVRREYRLTALLGGADNGDIDNIHQTWKDRVEEPLESPDHRLAGCAECFHTHWRWSSLVPETDRLLFTAFNGGRPLIGTYEHMQNNTTPDQDLEVGVARYRAGEEHPNDFHDLIPEESAKGESIRDVVVSRLRFVPKRLGPAEVVLWYSPTSREPRSDMFFSHGAWYNPQRGGEVGSVIVESTHTGAASSSAQAVSSSTGDAPTNIIFSHLFEEGATTFHHSDPQQVGQLPPGYTVYNNDVFEIETEAVVAAPYTVTFKVPSVGSDQALFNSLRILTAEEDPFEPGKTIWVDNTILAPDSPAPDFASQTITAKSDSLGKFLIARFNAANVPALGTADLSAGVTASSAQVIEGNNLTFTLTVMNNGPQPALQTNLVDTLAPDTAFVSATPSQGSCTFLDGSVYCKLGQLNVGGTATVSVVVKATQPQGGVPAQGKLVDNSVQVVAEEDDGNLENNSATTIVTMLSSGNAAPIVEITSPAAESIHQGPLNMTIRAFASDRDGTVQQVNFYDGDKLIGSGQPGAPGQYTVAWNNVSFGPHLLQAMATDNLGKKSPSKPVLIQVNGPAAVSIASPTAGAIIPPDQDVTISANVTHPSGSVNKVEFYASKILIGTATGAGPYSVTWASVPRGNYDLMAVATDNEGFASVSQIVPVAVTNPRTISITSPRAGTSIPSATNIVITTSLNDTEQQVTQVLFYADGDLIGLGIKGADGQYTFTWRTATEGIHSLQVFAVDSFGVSTSSATVDVGVDINDFEPGDVVWFDDSVPRGARTFGTQDGWFWVNANPAPLSGSSAHQSMTADGFHRHGFDGATFRMPVNAVDRLYTWVFISPGYRPQEIMLEWKDETGWEHRAYWSDRETSRINLGTEGTVSRHRVGPMPPEGRWVRLEVPSQDVGLSGKVIDGMTFILHGGRATFDRAGKTDHDLPPGTPGDTVWFDDNLPTGAVPGWRDDHWSWVTSNPTPFGGTGRAHQTFQGDSGDSVKYRSHFFTNATQTMRVEPGDILFTYVYLDPVFTPDQLILEWNDGKTWRRAYWGSNFRVLDRLGTENMRYMGGIPQAGEWVRLEVPASYVGLENRTVSGMGFGMNREGKRGLVTWDRTGKSTSPPTTSIEPLYATHPIYRYFHSSEGYYYFTDDKRGANIQPGVRWYVHPNQAAGTVPLYRWRNTVSHRYVFTQQQLPAAGSGWVLDTDPAIGDGGIAFYIYPNGSTPGTAELHRFRGPLDYFFTTDRFDRAAAGMTYEGVAGWVHPGRSIISPVPNPIDDPEFFVKQHYRDFLNREADAPGLAFWLDDYHSCPAHDLACVDVKRNNISAAFFLSIEFQQTGYYAHRFYRASYNRFPTMNELFADKEIVAAGIVVGADGWEAKLNQNKAAFADSWVGRQDFRALYDGMSNAQYVDALYANTGVTPEPSERDALVGSLDANTDSRAGVLKKIVESPAVHAKEVNAAFVLMQYFGYLRRNPNDSPDNNMDGFNFWLKKLNDHQGNFIAAEMVKSFLVSIEYRARFGQPQAPSSAANLTVGGNVSAKAGMLTGTFQSVSSEGVLKTAPVYPWNYGPPPEGYTFYKNLAWSLTTTAGTSPPYTITVSVPWEVNDPAEFANLRVFNREGDAWVDRTVLGPDAPAPDFANRTISARVNTLSTIMVAHQGSSQIKFSLTSPADGTAYNAPATININAAAFDPNAVITRVQFFDGETLLGEDNAAPYSFTLSGVEAGSHTITAKAWDNLNVMVASASANVVVNGPPAVVITSPAANATFDAPANITINAYASDAQGINRVEFYQGATKLGEDTTAPYSFNWANAPVGAHSLTAVAKDNSGASMTSTPVAVTVRNLLPTVAITAPGDGTFAGNAPAAITVNATAQDSNGISKVEFFQGTTKLGEDTAAPFSFAWNNVAVGTYSLTARATDGLGAVATSAAVTVTVGNAPPSVAITSPANATNAGNAPANITIQATATDNEGVNKVEFFRDGTSLGVDTTAPYSVAWNGVAAGTYSLTAKATDTLGSVTTSSPVSVTVSNGAPTVSITSPVGGSSYNAPASVAITATAADNEGIAKVEFFQGATKLGEDTTAPYTFTWSNVAAGTYSLTAKATDNMNAVATSGAVSISVGGALFTLFSDDFNDNTIDPAKWYVTDSLSASLVAERNQRLELTPATAANVTAYNGYASVPSIDMTNAQVTVEVPQYAPSHGHETYFQLVTNTGNTLLFVAGGAGLIMQDSSTGSAGRTILASYNTTQHRFWRFRHDPATDKILWETSDDGAAWITQRSVTRPFAITSMIVQLIGGKYAGTALSPATSVFDNLKVLSAVANTQPAVSITSPANGTVLNAPASATITASASDSDGTITRVEFFSGSTSLGVDTTAPYSVAISNAAAGVYSLTARAWDNRGGITTSAPVVVTVNAPPSVSVTLPANGATYTAPATVTLAATASDSDGTISSVEFFRNGTSLGVDTTSPYSVTWSNVAAGTYSLTARATDNRGAAVTSAAISITVSAPNAAPTVSLTAPASGSVYTTPAAINLTATASDSDGTISSVEFFKNGVSLGVDTTAPYGLLWTGVPAGSYSLTAKATDNAGATATSAAVNVIVNAQPSAPRADTVGVYTNTTYYLRNSNTPGPADITRLYGLSGWTPVVGDWDGNGTTTLGVFNPNNGQGQSVFYLSNRTDTSAEDTTVVFGLPGDKPVAGDWDGNGTVTIGVYRESEYKFYLRNTNTTGPADIVVSFYPTYYGETPVAGDWDGDGIDTIGMHRSSNATFYLRNTNTSGPLDVTVGFGNIGDIPIVGDWDGDGKTTVGSFTGPSATFYLRNVNTTGPADMAFQFGTAANSIPVAGNWDGARGVACGDTVWFDDALPTGAVAVADGDPWNWVQSGPVPFSGKVAHQSAAVAASHQHYFYNSTQTLAVNAGEKLYAYVYLDPANLPSEVMLQWQEAGSYEHRAYWGANQIPWGVDGTASRRYMGPLPPAGEWVRLEVPASQVDLEGRVLTGMAFSLYGGRATWDRAGKTTAAPPNVLISEFRFRGAGGASDEFVELYNNSDAPVTVCATDGSGGWALAAADGLTRFTVPSGTVIPARGHYLATAPAYGLGAYAASDKPYTVEIADNTGVALFNTRNPFGFTSSNRFDAAGFSTLTNSLYFEGTGLATLGAINGEYSFVRRFAGAYPQDTNNNAADFAFVSNTGDFYGGSIVSMLGGAGPENLFSPLLRNGPIAVVMLDAAASSSVAPNRVRLQCDQTPDCNPASAPIGTLVVRRKLVNNTGVTLTGLRVRLMDFTTLNSPGYTNTGQADMRALSSADSNVTLTDGSTVLVKGATLEQPPNQPVGGGYNSTLRIPLPPGGLPPGGTVNVQFVLGMHRSGTFRFFFITEALP